MSLRRPEDFDLSRDDRAGSDLEADQQRADRTGARTESGHVLAADVRLVHRRPDMPVGGVQSSEFAFAAEEEVLVAAEIESVRMEVTEQAAQAERGASLTRGELRKHDDEPVGSLDPLQRLRQPSLVLGVRNVALEPHGRRRDHRSRKPYSKAKPEL